MYQCSACGAAISERPVRRSTCPSCGADLHSCVNCARYSRGRQHDCSEPQAELVKDKKRANFCDFFQMRAGKGGPRKKESTAGESARDRFDELFGG